MALITLEKLTVFATALADKITENFVKKESGKGLSSNDFTSAYKNKLENLTEITVDSALSSSSMNPVQNKVVKSGLD
ncbi:MAG: hypothetical protein K2L07_10510, partial [Lachnospiraceae bacterium]|nr:hypothetical protein [Lachnospiraceae bacterium]